MKDFLRGTLGTLLQIVLGLLGGGLVLFGGLSCVVGSKAGGSLLVILGILCFCAVVGIRYWLGSIIRPRM